MMTLDLLLYVALGLAALYLYIKHGRGHRKGKPIPGPTGTPFVGFGFKLKSETLHETFAELANTYGDIFRITAFGNPIVVLNRTDLIRSMFGESPYKRFACDRIGTFMGQHVLFDNKATFTIRHTYNSPHAHMRKAFNRSMHLCGEGTQLFEDKFNSELVQLNAKLELLNEDTFELGGLIQRSLCNFVSLLVSGQTLRDDQAEHFVKFVDAYNIILSPTIDLVLATFPSLRFLCGLDFKKNVDVLMAIRDAILERQFHEAKRTYQPGTVRGLVDFYLTEQQEAKDENRPIIFTDDRICAVVLETVSGSMLTLRAALTSIFLCLITHPDYQARAQEEIDAVIGRDRTPTLADRPICVMVEAIVMETLRYMSPVPFPVPHLCVPNMEFKGFDIPKNSRIFANLWFVHHDEMIWGDPWTFRPDRWIQDNGELLPSDHILRKNLIPFSSGRRECPAEGLARSRIFLYVATLLQRWTFLAAPGHTLTSDPRQGILQTKLVFQPKPYLCRAVPRQ